MKCTVSLKHVGPLFQWAPILTVHYYNNVVVRVTLLHWGYWQIFGIAALWNSGPESSKLCHDPQHTSLYCSVHLTFLQALTIARLVTVALQFYTLQFSPEIIFAVFGQWFIWPLHNLYKLFLTEFLLFYCHFFAKTAIFFRWNVQIFFDMVTLVGLRHIWLIYLNLCTLNRLP